MSQSWLSRGGAPRATRPGILTSGGELVEVRPPCRQGAVRPHDSTLPWQVESQAEIETRMFPLNHQTVSSQVWTVAASRPEVPADGRDSPPKADNPHLRHGYTGHLGNRERQLSGKYKIGFGVQLHSENHRNPNAHQQLKVAPRTRTPSAPHTQ